MINRGLYFVALFMLVWVVISPALPRLEGMLYPVVNDTHISSVEPYPRSGRGWSLISGTSNKLRDCDFLAIEWYLGRPGARVGAQITLLEPTRARPSGEFEWGDWAVQLTPDQLRYNSYAVVLHECHPLWSTKTLFWLAEADAS